MRSGYDEICDKHLDEDEETFMWNTRTSTHRPNPVFLKLSTLALLPFLCFNSGTIVLSTCDIRILVKNYA